MLHVIHLVRRRWPAHAGTVVATLIALSAALLALGAGLMLP